MTDAADIVPAFLGGFALELTAVTWAVFVQSRSPVRAAAVSALQATAMVCGLDAALHSNAQMAAFVCGYGLGSGLAVAMTGYLEGKHGHS